MSGAGAPDPAPRGVTAVIEGGLPGAAVHYAGAAILRPRPHPVLGVSVPQLGVPDDALGFRPTPGARFAITIQDGGAVARYRSPGAWLERVGSTWWFILEAE
ncbi:MAG TPA: hypothetical protein VFA70_12575 [Dehalococcoidia bacterium]|jgi:hypothetical protein|nr:hypothetical protein [Dehalococcoidia bacterium]